MNLKFLRKRLCLSIIIILSTSLFPVDKQEVVFFSSIPKTGSNLLLKLLRNLKPKKIVISCLDRTNLKHNLASCLHKDALHNPEDLAAINWAHVVFNQELYVLTDTSYDKRLFFIYRDPRDQIVSAAFYIYALPQLWPNYCAKPLDDLISELIINCKPIFDGFLCSKIEPDYKTINDFYNLFLPWRNSQNIYTTTFEKLAGPKAGGSLELQIQEVKNIAQHLGITLTDQEALNQADALWGAGDTFREGKIGSWKKYFKDEHKRLFKEVAGQLLISLGYEKDLNW